MSLQLINHSPDLKRLRDEGYALEVRAGHLIVSDVPYLTSSGEIKRGAIVSTLILAGDKTGAPDTHVAHFIGEYPCHENLQRIEKIFNASNKQKLGNSIDIDHTFSAKPKDANGQPTNYANYYDKMTNYAAIVSGPAQVKDRSVTARTYRVIPSQEDSYFEYVDTASSRASIGAVTEKLRGGKIAIIGLGGTGSYILDQIAKTPVLEIHLYDDDQFLQHNAFRSPGAPSLQELDERPNKAEYFKRIYSKMKKGIVAHSYRVTHENISELKDFSFVFICIDSGEGKRVILENLETFGIKFIDVGMGIYLVDDKLGGIIRATSSTDNMRSHIKEKNRIALRSSDANDYSTNIQIADLNALNAMMAVIKWKKIMGFYLDLENEHHTAYTIDGNVFDNDDKAGGTDETET